MDIWFQVEQDHQFLGSRQTNLLVQLRPKKKLRIYHRYYKPRFALAFQLTFSVQISVEMVRHQDIRHEGKYAKNSCDCV